MLFRKSLLYIEKEKMLVLGKELRYLYLICDFYDVEENSTSSEKKDLEHSFNILKKEIEKIKKNLKKNFDALSKQIDWLETLENKEQYEIQSLIYIDMLREYIKYLVYKIDLISIKISQLLRDGYNQYIPKPIIGKRHSSINITSQVELSLKRRLKELEREKKLTSTDIEPIVIWDYNDEYRIISNPDIIVFNLSYWYFEFSYFLPNLTHEIGHYIQNDIIKKRDYNVLKNLINKESNKLFKKERDTYIISDNLLKEILSDLIALLYHGSSYIYALTHKLLGSGLSLTFKAVQNDVYDNKYRIVDMSSVRIESSFLISNYRFNIKRDLVFIRLYILLAVREVILNKKLDKKGIFNEDDIYIKDIKRLLNSIYNLNNTKFSRTTSCLDDVYKNYHNFLINYKSVKNIVENISKAVIGLLECDKNIIKNLDISKNENISNKYEFPIYFNDIWNKRFDALRRNKTIHRFEYRKKLHRKTLEKLIESKYLDNKKYPIEPYNMVFIKYRIDNLDFQPDKFIKNGNIIEEGRVLGIYDYVYFEKLDLESKVDSFPELKEEKIKYYESSFSLMKILNDTNGNQPSNDKNVLNAIIQVEVSKRLEGSENDEDIYEDLYRDLIKIHDIFENDFKCYKNNFAKIEYFKSLGPKDITIRIDSSNIDFIFEAKRTLYEKFKRTFTTFYLKKDIDESFVKSTKNHPFVSYLRMSPDYDSDAFERKYRKYKKDIKVIFLKTGVMDYRIVWEHGVSLKVLKEFYNELLDKRLVADIQTSIDENIKLK